MFHQWYHCHVTWYWTIIIKRSIINIEMQSFDRRLWLLLDLIRRWAYVYMISRCLRAMMTLIRRTTNIRRSIARLYANLYFSLSLCTWRCANVKTMIISTVRVFCSFVYNTKPNKKIGHNNQSLLSIIITIIMWSLTYMDSCRKYTTHLL